MREAGVRDFTDEQGDAPLSESQMTDEEQEEFIRQAREMILLREQRLRTAKRESALKETLMKELSRFGLPYGDQGQHRTFEFPRPIRGVYRFVRQTKVTTKIDETKAEAIARQRGIYDRLFKPVMVLDEAAALVALEEGILTDADFAEMFPKQTDYAFVVEKKK